MATGLKWTCSWLPVGMFLLWGLTRTRTANSVAEPSLHAEAAQASGEAVLLADTFDLNAIDTSKWQVDSLFSGFSDASVSVADNGQQLQIGPLKENASGSHYNGLGSAEKFNFSGAYCYVEVVSPPASNTAADA
ncbi:MAG: hypothetical protein ACREDR_05500, partial [Blastocatellia bacterium]